MYGSTGRDGINVVENEYRSLLVMLCFGSAIWLMVDGSESVVILF